MLQLRLALPAFRSARQLILGPDSIMALRSMESSRVALVVSGSLVRQEDLFEKLKRNIRAHDIRVIERSWRFEPTMSDLRAPLQTIEEARVDTIVAVGGGAVIDAAKLMWLFYEHPNLDSSIYLRPFAVPKLRGRARFVAVPTTTGTGSEVSSAALLYNPETGGKDAIVTHDFLPDVVILDPKLLTGLVNTAMISTVCDALSHAIEGYVSRIQNPLMDLFAEKAVQVIADNWRRALERNVEAIGQLQYAATMAGWVQNHCLVGASHALAHQLAPFNVPHGVANAILLPTVIRQNARNVPTKMKYENLARLIGVEESAEGLASFVEEVRMAGGVASKLSDFGCLDPEPLLAGAMCDPGAKSNPIELNEQLLRELVKECL